MFGLASGSTYQVEPSSLWNSLCLLAYLLTSNQPFFFIPHWSNEIEGSKIIIELENGKTHFGILLSSSLRSVLLTNTELLSTNFTELMSTTEFSSTSELS